ncbi:hypothetical protein [Acinetobacter sp. ANC 3813]|uniref:hypothetical protein n=1 Tax=Acinetobacter sp. ANC 3813 TaxID=1977873 RepID=UPI000A33D09C|nr:hypothetical protein [Acinetobacter sp. ANC 3813]OTG91997.1 hypothetical protein B9T34_01215 [Acinetobacter sp. ANC 3813]
MILSFRALAACFCFYSALYLVYAFFFKGNNPFYIIAALGLFAGSWFFTPYSYEERQRQGFDSTLTLGSIFYHPLLFWGQFFSWPIRILLSLLRD